MRKELIERLNRIAENASSVTRMCSGCLKSVQVWSVSSHENEDYECDECRQKREDREYAEERGNLWREVCPAEYRATNEERLQNGSGDLWEAIQLWSYCSMGLGFVGKAGRGKTRAMWILLKRLHDAGKKIVAIDSAELSRGIALRYSENPADAVRWIESMIKADLFFLDDHGKGKMTERVESELFGIIEGRIKHQRPIMFTSNMTVAEMKKSIYTDNIGPIYRRLLEFCRIVEIK